MNWEKKTHRLFSPLPVQRKARNTHTLYAIFFDHCIKTLNTGSTWIKSNTQAALTHLRSLTHPLTHAITDAAVIRVVSYCHEPNFLCQWLFTFLFSCNDVSDTPSNSWRIISWFVLLRFFVLQTAATLPVAYLDIHILHVAKFGNDFLPMRYGFNEASIAIRLIEANMTTYYRLVFNRFNPSPIIGPSENPVLTCGEIRRISEILWIKLQTRDTKMIIVP